MKKQMLFVLVPAAALLVIVVGLIAATTKGTRTEWTVRDVKTGILERGKTWVTDDRIWHSQNEVSTRTILEPEDPEILGDQIIIYDANVSRNLETGESSMSGKLTVMKEGQVAWEGTFRGSLSEWQVTLRGVGAKRGLRASGTSRSEDMTETSIGTFVIRDPHGE